MSSRETLTHGKYQTNLCIGYHRQFHQESLPLNLQKALGDILVSKKKQHLLIIITMSDTCVFFSFLSFCFAEVDNRVHYLALY